MLGGSGNFVLTRSSFWDPPNVAHYWFTVWDLASGLPLIDCEHVGTDGGHENEITNADLSSDERFLLLGSDNAHQASRCIQLSPPPELRSLLPDVAEAFGGLKVESDGSFSIVPDRLRQIDSFLAAWKHSIKLLNPLQ